MSCITRGVLIVLFVVAILVSLPDIFSCDSKDPYTNDSSASSHQIQHGFYEHFVEHIMPSKDTKLSNESLFEEVIDFSPFFSGIIKTVLQFTWEMKNLKIITHTDCSHDNIKPLVLILQRYVNEAVCKQVGGYDELEAVEYVRTAHAEAVVFLLPWYYTERLVERLTNLAFDTSVFVTVEISEVFVRRMKDLNSHVKVSNVLLARPNHPFCKRVTPLNFLLLKRNIIEIDTVHQVMICNSIENRPLRVVTVDTNDLYMSLQSRATPDFTQLIICDVGLPCRKSEKENDAIVWKWYCCHGIHIDFLQLIVDELNTKFEIYIVQDNRFGNKVNDEWNGVVDDVLKDKADLGLHLFNVLPSRQHVVDFTFSVSKDTDGFGVLRRKSEKDYKIINWAFAQSMDTELVYVSILIAVAIAFVLILIENLILRQFTDKRYSASEGISHITGVLLQRDVGGSISHTWAGQILSILFALSMTVLISSFIARITATGIAKELDTFEGFKDKRFKDPNYKVAMWKGAATQMFYDKLEGLKAQKIYIEKEPYDELLNGEIDFYVCPPDYTEYIINQNKEYNENLHVYKEDGYEMDYGFVVQKNSILGQKITRLLLSLKSKRTLYEIIDKWMIKKRHVRKNDRFPWEYAGGLMLILGVTVCVCIVILLIEHLYTCFKRKRARSFDIINI